ncbi:MAG: hypothetical protein JSV91_11650 [Phycisphaerales bacterium]|nr:MAG: hypothetical protein JSV91_11650 [Phycisphaerales bacterium]
MHTRGTVIQPLLASTSLAAAGLAASSGLLFTGAASAGSRSIDCQPVQVAKCVAPDGSSEDYFGLSADIDGDTFVVGSIWDDSNGYNSGSAYVFTQVDGSWFFQAKLLPSDGAVNDNFGRSVGISGDTIVVGANLDDDHGSDSGSAYVFVRQGSAWVQQAKLLAADGAPNDRMGWSSDISGDTIVVSSHRNDDHGTDSGSAYVFVRGAGDSWSQEAKLTASDGAADDLFGHSVTVSGDTVLAGAYHDDDHGSDSGSAYVFVRGAGSAWTQQAKLTASDANVGYHFGRFVDLDEDVALIGSPMWWPLNFGAAYVFRRNGTSWLEEAQLTSDVPTSQEWFGSDVAICSGRAVVGTLYFYLNGPGAAYVFAYDDGQWTFEHKIVPSDAQNGDEFGAEVALDGETAIITSDADDDAGYNSGSVYVWDLNCTSSGCTGDLNEDGVVNIDDLFTVLGAWGTCDECVEDINDDGKVDIDDIFALLGAWGPCP